uniref:CSON014537 protein n=1 Tax=Culicoides sonorensis TaxID=179676 RepID=A0A336MAS8_CULSO
MKSNLLTFFVLIMIIMGINALPPPRLNLGIHKDKCMAESGASPESVEKIRNHEAIDDEEGKCFKKCMCLNLGLCDDKMRIKADVLLEKKPFLPADKVLQEIPKCNELKGRNECDTVFTRYLCFWEKVPEVRSHKPW